MAIGIHEQQDTKYGIVFGNTHATGAPIFTSTTAFEAINTAGLPIDTSVVFNKNVVQRIPDRMNGKRNATLEDTDFDMKGVNPTANMKFPATYATLDLVCACIFQGVTEGGSTPYPKTFNIPTSYPDFSTTGGGYVGFVKSLPASLSTAGLDEYITSAIATKVVFSCYPDQNEGRLTLDVDWMGRYYGIGDYTGTLTYPTTFSYWHFADLLSVELDTVAALCSGFTITFELDAAPKPVGGTGTLGTQTYALQKWKCTGSIDIEHTTTTGAYFEQEQIGTAMRIEIAWGSKTGAASGDLYFHIPNAKPYADTYKGTANDIRTLNFVAVEKVASTAAKMFTVIMANAVSRETTYTSGIWTL